MGGIVFARRPESDYHFLGFMNYPSCSCESVYGIIKLRHQKEEEQQWWAEKNWYPPLTGDQSTHRKRESYSVKLLSRDTLERISKKIIFSKSGLEGKAYGTITELLYRSK